MMLPWMEGCRVLWDGKLWAVLDCYSGGVLDLMRAVVPMKNYENVRVHISETYLEDHIIRSEN